MSSLQDWKLRDVQIVTALFLPKHGMGKPPLVVVVTTGQLLRRRCWLLRSIMILFFNGPRRFGDALCGDTVLASTIATASESAMSGDVDVSSEIARGRAVTRFVFGFDRGRDVLWMEGLLAVFGGVLVVRAEGGCCGKCDGLAGADAGCRRAIVATIAGAGVAPWNGEVLPGVTIL